MLLRLYMSISRHKPTIKRREKHISHLTEAKSGTLPTVHQRDIIKAHIKVRCFMRYPKYQDQEEIHIMCLGNFLEFFFSKKSRRMRLHSFYTNDMEFWNTVGSVPQKGVFSISSQIRLHQEKTEQDPDKRSILFKGPIGIS